MKNESNEITKLEKTVTDGAVIEDNRASSLKVLEFIELLKAIFVKQNPSRALAEYAFHLARKAYEKQDQ